MTTPPPLPRQPDPRVRKDMPVVTWTGSWGTTSIQQALDNHDLGQFLLSAQLAETVQRDDRVATALNTRCKGLMGLPREVSPSPRGDRRKAKGAAKDLDALWAETDLTESLLQMLRWCVLMGFALGEILWSGDADGWSFSLKVWHPQFVWFNWATRRYQVNTMEGVVEVTPGDGKWFLLTPEGDYRAWIQGAIRSIAIPWLGRQYAFRDWMRFNEIYGLPIRKAIVPAQTPEDDKNAYLDDIAAAGSAMSVSCPQGTDGKGYDLQLVEATATGWETFRNATEDADRRITLALLGQNLTTEVSGGSYAAAKVHGQVRQDYLEADERGLMAGFRRQVLRPWAAFNLGDPDLAPVVRFETEPPDDEKAKADVLVQLGAALLNLAQVAPEVDRRALLARYNLPLHEPGEEPPPLVPPQGGAPPAAPLAPLPDAAVEPPPADGAEQPAEPEQVHRLGHYDDIDFTPPEGAREEAQRGLDWREEHGRGGTEVGVARARDLANGRNLSPETVRRMKAYFDRHEADKSGEGWSPGEDGYPSAGRIAWALWGGDPGRSWAEKVVGQMESRDERASAVHDHPHTLAVTAPAPAKAAQAYVEDAASVARDRAARALSPAVRTLLDRIASASSYDEIRAALASVPGDIDLDQLTAVTEQTLLLSTLAGRYAVRSLEPTDARLPAQQPVLSLLRHRWRPRRQCGSGVGRRDQLHPHPRRAGRRPRGQGRARQRRRDHPGRPGRGDRRDRSHYARGLGHDRAEDYRLLACQRRRMNAPLPTRPADAVAWHRARVPMTEEAFKALSAQAKQQAVTVAGATSLQLVVDVQEAIASALANGTTLEDFKATVGPSLTAAWVGTKVDPPSRLETIFRTTTQTAYNAGRHIEATDPDTLAMRPFWQFDAVVDGRTTSGCKLANGVVLPADHPWWERNFPPRHFNCFPPGTVVTTDRGDVPIECVQPGDRVLTHRGRMARVYATYRTRSPDRLVEVSLGLPVALRGTGAHPALTHRGWVKLSDLRPGDCLVRVVPATGDRHSVGDREGFEADLAEVSDTLDWHATGRLADLHDEVERWDEEVCEVERVAHDHRRLRHAFQAVACQPSSDPSLGLGEFPARLRVRVGVQPMSLLAGLHALTNHIGLTEPPALGQFAGGRCDAKMGFFGVSKGPMPITLSDPCDRLSHASAGSLAPCHVASPLHSDGLSTLANADAVFAQQSAHGFVTGRPQDDHELPVRLPLNLVEVAEVGANIHASLDKAGLDSLVCHVAKRCPSLATVKATRSVSAVSKFVFNLGVETDESYVANGFVVHNCRATFHPLTRRQANAIGVSSPPAVMAAEGFGSPPT